MKNKKSKIEIIELYKKGLTASEINNKTGYTNSLINVYISKHNRNTVKTNDLFNVNKYDCWIFPNKEQ